jgi:zinc protease
VAAIGVSALALSSCAPTEPADSAGAVAIDFEKYELPNGLDVVLHVDRSDPIAAVAMTFHVGSTREVEGKTGFAHLFEHLFFLDSENLGPGGLDRLMTRIGSSTNGSTNRDWTNYYEVVPVDGLEKALWAEADKLGFFINTVTESVVDKEKEVVKNEKRQSYDNQPYGHTSYVIDRALYPEGHPHRWQVIGSLADLESAALADVLDFHEKWYGPNNATLVVAGDLDVERTKEWIERYFAEIPTRALPATPEVPDPTLAEPVLLVHEDNFARVPMLTVAWPSVPLFHPDSYPLDVLASLLTDGKSTPFYDVLVEEEQVAPDVSAANRSSELAGRFTLQIRAYEGTDLDNVQAAVDRAFAAFEERGVQPEELRRVKAGYETGFYSGLSSVLGKAFELARYNILAADPGFVSDDFEQLVGVTAEDVLRVYDTYLRGRPYVAASFVPRGSPELALEGSSRAHVVEEPIVRDAAAEVAQVARGDARTPSSIDRSVEPPFGPEAPLRVPEVWRAELANGVHVLGIQDGEVPMVDFELSIEGGAMLEDPARAGVANLLAETMLEGTARRTAEELENAIDLLGASIQVNADAQAFVISGSTLARNYAETMDLVAEVLLEPRFAEEGLSLARQRVRSALLEREASPVALASDVFRGLLYGDHALARNPLGDLESVEAITLDDLRSYHGRALSPALASVRVAGAVTEAEVMESLTGLAERWEGAAPELPDPPVSVPSRDGLYFVDVPGASQSVLRIGYLALAESDPAFYPATIMNFRLGGGGFASDLLQVLREQRGYTYGISSGFSGTELRGPFQIASSVRSNVTYEALALIKDIVEGYGPTFDETDLEATRGFLLRANARAFETRGAKLEMLADIDAYDFPTDYVLRRETAVRDMTVEALRSLAERYLAADEMIWLVVGDADSQLARLTSLGLGEPTLLDREGRPLR